jgi:pimeloyl-ACP methyl ester carboxylesterase
MGWSATAGLAAMIMGKETCTMADTAHPPVPPAPRLKHVQCLGAQGLHRMAYWEWGDAANPRVLVCAHGLSRQGRDFDTLAAALCGDYRVVCPDVVGRGESDWLADPAGYAIPAYVADMVTLLARLDAQVLHWVGTSMGGLIGLGLASLPGSPVQRLVLNDVGPAIEWASLQRIGSYLGLPAHWPTEDAAADALWAISQGFGPHSRDQWLALTRPQLRPDGDGFKPHYDPAIAVPFRQITPALAQAGEAALWASYDRLTCPTLLIRGEQSDLLSAATAQAMTLRGPRARLAVLPGVGHAPTLVQADQVALVRGFLHGA